MCDRRAHLAAPRMRRPRPLDALPPSRYHTNRYASRKRPELTRDDWIALGLAALRDEGPAALALNALTEQAGATRGSFYHHFADQPDFLESLVERWAAASETRLAAALAPPPDARPAPPVALLSVIDPALEAAIRALALAHPALRPAIVAADAARIRLLAAAQSDPASDAAQDYARIEYAAALGLGALGLRTPAAETLRLASLTADLVAAHWNE